MFFPLVSTGVFNVLIDPYNFFDTPIITKINHIKPEEKEVARISKAITVRKIKPKIVLLGTSRVETSLSAEHPAFKQSYLAYNLGFQAGNMYEIMRYFQHALAHQPDLKQVIIGLDFFSFNANFSNRDTFSESRLGTQFPWQDFVDFSLSFDALLASHKSFNASINNQQKEHIQEPLSRFKFWLTGFLDSEDLYKGYQFSEERLVNFKTIIDTCKKNNIEIIVFISPTHATHYEAISASGLWSTFEQWKREVVQITPVWDFSGYNSITTELIDDRMEYYIDNSHYSPKVGDLVLNRILSFQTEKVPRDFGVLVNQDNIESHLEQIRLDREVWREKHPEELNLVRKIKAKLDN
ncbi:MAG: hypothetical protein QNJ34_02210 [Xenococcaceae cyanobacterium MO_188.B29]|nr:hypothetical protein [Xenococcaceae cyanobacterium MO_188.B29]